MHKIAQFRYFCVPYIFSIRRPYKPYDKYIPQNPPQKWIPNKTWTPYELITKN